MLCLGHHTWILQLLFYCFCFETGSFSAMHFSLVQNSLCSLGWLQTHSDLLLQPPKCEDSRQEPAEQLESLSDKVSQKQDCKHVSSLTLTVRPKVAVDAESLRTLKMCLPLQEL